MRSLVKLVVFLAVLAVVGYAGTRGYIWYEVKKQVDKTVKEVAPFADLTYQSIYSSPMLDGSVGVDGIVIKPKTTSDEFKIHSIRVKFPDVLALITAGRDLKKREIPERMKLSISDISVDLNSQIFYTLKEMQKQVKAAQGAHKTPLIERLDALGCGDVDTIGIDELTHMGYSVMDLDLEMEYDFKRESDLLTLAMSVRSKGMYSFNVKADMNVDADGMLHGKMSPPTISSMTIDYTDTGYAALRNRFCASQLNASQDVFIDKHIVLLSRAFSATFPDDVVAAYKKFMTGDSKVSVSLTPKPGTDLTSLGMYQPKDIVDMLGVSMKIDKLDVDFNKFGWGKHYDMPESDASSQQQTETPSATNGSEAAASIPTPTPAKYRPTAPSRLGKFIGSQAKIKVYGGQLREGIIETVSSDYLTLRMVSDGGRGSISFRIPVDNIASAEVLY